MYLSKLEIHGFKSFQQKTAVKFDRGMTAIVGPNGCGKTNIVDALRWSLGEQKSSTLRSDKMENVIFNGTSAKKPMGMAEVSLTIQNDKGILPSEYTEVVITRRIFRSGESEYLMNKSLCRLKDITGLFMDTGMGANAYSVIELKMVENILSNKAEERRLMFEEAAGVNKYKHRRRLTLRKLDDVRADLARVNDIIAEVEKKVRSLERQAKKADKYNTLSKELKEIEIELAERELAKFVRQVEEYELKKNEALAKKTEIESSLDLEEEQLQTLKDEQIQIETTLKEKRKEIAAQVEKVHRAEQIVSVSQEGRKSQDRNIYKYKQELEELEGQLVATEDSIEENQGNIEEITATISAREMERDNIAEKVQEQKEKLETERKNLKDYSDMLLEKFKEITGKQNDLKNKKQALERIKKTIEKHNSKIQALSGNIAKTVGFLEELNKDKDDSVKKLKAVEEEHQKKQVEKEELEKKLSTLRSNELELKGDLNDMRAKIEFLENLIENLEGFSKGTKALLENEQWTKKDKNLLANIGNTTEKYRFAIESALKNNLNNILVESVDEINNALKYLRENKSGKASFYIYGEGSGKSRSFFDKMENFVSKQRVKKLEKESGFVNWAAELIETQKKWKPFFRKFLAKTAIIDTFENAYALAEKFPMFRFVTLNGDFIDQQGVIEVGSEPELDDTLFGRKQLLEKLKNKLPAQEKKLTDLRAEIEETEERFTGIELKVYAEREKILFNDIANIDKQVSRAEFERQKAVDESEKARAEIQDLVKQSNELEKDATAFEENLATQVAEKHDADCKHGDLEKQYQEIEQEYNGIIAKQNSLNLEIERLNGEKRNYENAINRGYETIETVKRSIAKRQADIENAQEEIITLDNIIEEKTLELDELNADRMTLVEEEAKIDGEFKELRERIKSKDQELKSSRRERDDAGNSIHAAEMKLNEISIKLKNMQENIAHKYSIEVELKTFDDQDEFDFGERKSNIRSLEQQINNLGPVNSLAYVEYDEEKERLDFLTGQRDDLNNSEKDLLKTIEEINETAQSLFTDTFEKIRENFIKIFRSLFNPGDEADLKMEEGADSLEGKIEIIAKPKGKRPTSIELLSGGEKTLTAIALLFAIYLVKPSPFCILDEIDAPLDDANIDRFTKILRDFSENTQFIVVTHNKRTMEAADALYGVTMQDEGISKLVSVKFNEDFNFVA